MDGDVTGRKIEIIPKTKQKKQLKNKKWIGKQTVVVAFLTGCSSWVILPFFLSTRFFFNTVTLQNQESEGEKEKKFDDARQNQGKIKPLLLPDLRI